MTATSSSGISDKGDIGQSRGCEGRKLQMLYADMFIRVLLLPSRLQYASINKLSSICSIIVLVNILFPTTSGFGFSDTDKKMLLSTCDLELSQCPMDQDSVEIRKLCMALNNYKGCLEGTSYLCGVDTKDEYIVETCQPEFICPPGTSFRYVVTMTAGKPEAHLECIPCLGDRFQPGVMNSSRTSITRGCTYVHVPQDNLSSHLVLFEMGTKSKASLYVCDYENNFHERNGIVFVDDIPTRSFECVQKFCPVGDLLHPDGRCIECETKLVPEEDFICDDRLGKSLGSASIGFNQEKDETKVSVPAIVVPILIGLAFLPAVVCFIQWRRRRGHRYDRANDRENPSEEPSNSNNENEQHTCSAENACNNTNKINNSSIDTFFQGINHLEVHYHNGSTPGDNAMPETSSRPMSSTVEEDEGLKPHLRMHTLHYGTSIEDQ